MSKAIQAAQKAARKAIERGYTGGCCNHNGVSGSRRSQNTFYRLSGSRCFGEPAL